MTNKQKLTYQQNISLGYIRLILNRFLKIYNLFMIELNEQFIISNDSIAQQFYVLDKNNDINENVYRYPIRYNQDINFKTNYASNSSDFLFAVLLIIYLFKIVLLNLKSDSFKIYKNHFILILIRCKCLKILF